MKKVAGINLTILSLAAVALSATANAEHHDPLKTAIEGEHRTEAFTERDQYRNPYETLKFFEVEPHHTVVEIWPGGGWYTEILAPYLKNEGTFYAAHFIEDSGSDYYEGALARFKEKMASDELYSNVVITEFHPGRAHDIAPEGSADRVLTFRNLHNWYMQGGDDNLMYTFRAFYDALKPGGILGVVDHRLPEERDMGEMARSGYMKASWAITFAEAAGFELLESSEVNANPKDTSDYSQGVWTLPPTLRLGRQDRDRYLEIGESDRFTLKFRKPEE